MTIRSVPGARFVVKLHPDDRVTAHPGGRGLIICNPAHPPWWVREENGEYVSTPIDWNEGPGQVNFWPWDANGSPVSA